MTRLKELRLETGLKRSELARALNLPASTIANYENETRQMSYEMLILFADFFNVSIDYLLCRTDEFEVRNTTQSFYDAILSSQEKELIFSFRNCSNTGKNRTLEFCQLWSKNDNQ